MGGKPKRSTPADKRLKANKHVPEFKHDEPVGYNHRGQHVVGTVERVVTRGTSEATTRYAIKPPVRRVSSTGKVEKKLVIHKGSALHPSTKGAVAAARKAGQTKKFKAQNKKH